MYTIRTAAARAGVSSEAVRAWERRYGVVAPRRSENGYRVYDDEAIARLVAMRQLIDAGWSASLAAQHVIEHGPGKLEPIVGAAPGLDEQDLVAAFVRSAAAMDDAGMEANLDEMFARGSFERVAEDLVYPALRAVGERWQSGDLSVAAEHAASHAVLRRLAAAFDAAGRPDSQRPRLVVGMPPGSRHELGALGFAVAARRAGYGVTYVGADLPVEDWVRAARDADVVVIGAVTRSDVAPAQSVAKAVKAARPDILVAVGGRAAPAGREHLQLTDGPSAALATLSAQLSKR